MKFDGVIYDMDGVLTDTPDAWEIALRTACEENGVTLSAEEFEQCRGTSHTVLLRMRGMREARIQKILAKREELLKTLLPQYARWIPGAPEGLDTLRAAGTRLAVATNSHGRHVDVLDGALGLRARIRHIISSDIAGTLKPDPRHLFLAAERLELPVDRCLFVDDHTVGIQAAAAAGMAAALFRGPKTPKHLSHEREFTSHEQIVSAVLS